jgi:hypothetical protein
MRKSVSWLAVPAVVAIAACGRDDTSKMDESLRNDLSLASQVQPYQPQQFVSPAEQGYGYGASPYAPQAQPVGGYYPAATRSTPTIRRVPSRSTSSGGGVYSAPAPAPTRTVKHTKRDAAIGAAAGAAIGAVTSRDRLKGAVIGAAAGGILGAVLGNNVDKKKIPF